MKLTYTQAALLAAAMGAVIFFCRVFPFIFFSKEKTLKSAGGAAFLDFVERIAPPAAMTVLAFNSLGPSIKTLLDTVFSAMSSMPLPENHPAAISAIIAAALTVIIHLWKRNSLISIFGGTAIYMALIKTNMF